MDLITKTPGFVHIAEEIFSNLDRNSLLDCQKVNKYWASILRNPWFWFHRMTQHKILSQEHKNEWMDFCEKLNKLKTKKKVLASNVSDYFTKNLFKENHNLDLPNTVFDG